MNSLNEIVVSFENEQKENSYQQSEENNNKEIITSNKQLTYLIYHCYENLSKSLYKTTINKINNLVKVQNIDIFDLSWKIYLLRIKAQLKIVEKKFDKYLFDSFEKMKFKNKINSIKKYLNLILDDLNLFIQKFSFQNDTDAVEKLDELLNCYFEYIYLYCLFNKKLGNIVEVISFLSLFINLYNKTFLIAKSEHTLSYIEKCFILLCQVLISNEDYLKAIYYIDITINICFKHLIYNSKDIEDGVFRGNKNESLVIKKKENSILNIKQLEIETEKAYGEKKIKNVIFHIIILYFYRGLCYENLGKINLSIKCYYQCEWFKNNFFYHSFQKLSILFRNMIDKSLELKKALDFLIRRIKFLERMQFMIKKQLAKKEKDTEKKQLVYEELINGSKYKKLENNILKLNINEIDTINRFNFKKNIIEPNGRKREGIYKNIFMSDTRLLNTYLREDFRDIIDNMDKIKTLDINFVTKDKIQKFLRGIYFEQSLKRPKKKRKNIINDMKNNLDADKKRKKYIKYLTTKKTVQSISETYKITNDISTPVSKKEILNKANKKFSSDSTFKLAQILITKNKSRIFSPTSVKTTRPKSSISNRRQISLEKTQTIKRVLSPIFKKSESSLYIKSNEKGIFSPFSNRKKYLDNNNNTMITPIEKNKYVKKEYRTVKTNKKYRARSARLYNRIPIEDKKLNKFFNKKYLRKRNYIKALQDRDLKFQTFILKIKKSQIFPIDIYNKELMKQKANELFQRVIGVYLASPSNEKYNYKTVEKSPKLYEKLQNALISSLDKKAIIKYNIERNKERNKSRPMTEQMNLYLKDVDNKNKNAINNLEKNISDIKQQEIIEMKNYQRINKNIKLLGLKEENEKNEKSNINNKIKYANINTNYRDNKKRIYYKNNNNK